MRLPNTLSLNSKAYIRRCGDTCSGWQEVSDNFTAIAFSGLEAKSLPTWPIALLSIARAQSIVDMNSSELTIVATVDIAQVDDRAEEWLWERLPEEGAVASSGR